MIRVLKCTFHDLTLREWRNPAERGKLADLSRYAGRTYWYNMNSCGLFMQFKIVMEMYIVA